MMIMMIMMMHPALAPEAYLQGISPPEPSRAEAEWSSRPLLMAEFPLAPYSPD